MEIRLLRDSDDRVAVSRIYEESWKFAYKGIVPQAYLDSIRRDVENAPEDVRLNHLPNLQVNRLLLRQPLIQTSSSFLDSSVVKWLIACVINHTAKEVICQGGTANFFSPLSCCRQSRSVVWYG